MDDWPPTIPPREFTGRGWEIIGDPSDEQQITLHFEDGIFCGFDMPSTESPHPASEEALEKREQRRLAERLALRLREQKEVIERLGLSLGDDPDYNQTKAQLKALPKDSTTEKAVRKILKGDPLPDWPAKRQRDCAVLIAVIELAKKHHRPPTGDEVIDRMMEGEKRPKHWRDGNFLITDGDRGNVKKKLSESGFRWLGYRPRGYQGERYKTE